jgi:hypothetical protein
MAYDKEKKRSFERVDVVYLRIKENEFDIGFLDVLFVIVKPL